MKRVVFWVVAYILIAPIFAWRYLTPRAAHKKLVRFVEQGVRSGTIPFTRGRVEVRLCSDGIEVIESDGSFAKPWTAVTAAFDEPDGVYVEFTDRGQLRVPARAFEDVTDRLAFVGKVRDRSADHLAHSVGRLS